MDLCCRIKDKKYLTAEDLDEFEAYSNSGDNAEPRFSQESLQILYDNIKYILSNIVYKGYSGDGLHFLENFLFSGNNTWHGYLSSLRANLADNRKMNYMYFLPFIIPFEELPLYIHDEYRVTKIIVTWRLQVGE
jgi:hypothetical protein